MAIARAKGIPRRVEESLLKLKHNDYENAMIQAAIAVDATAKKKYSKKLGPGGRFRKFIDENEDFILCMALGGKTRIIVSGDLTFQGRGKISNILYRYVRNPLLHEGDASSDIAFTSEFKFGHIGHKVIIRDTTIWGVLLCVIGDSVNDKCELEKDIEIGIEGISLNVNSLWGKFDRIKELLNYRDIPKEVFFASKKDR
jgi:hypothetical protein